MIGGPQFHGPRGRSVRIETAIGSDPPLGNGSLSASPSAEQQAELLRRLQGD